MRILSILITFAAMAVASSAYGAAYREETYQWTWSFSLAAGSDPTAKLNFGTNAAAPGTAKAASDSAKGSFVITKVSTAPEGWRLVGPAPKVNFSVTADWTGSLHNDTDPYAPQGSSQVVRPYAKVTVSTKSQDLAAFDPTSLRLDDEAEEGDNLPINDTRTSSILVGEGAVTFAGSLSGRTLHGASRPMSVSKVWVDSTLTFTGEIIGPVTVDVKYAIPEPSTYALMLGGLASIAAFRAVRSRKK